MALSGVFDSELEISSKSQAIEAVIDSIVGKQETVQTSISTRTVSNRNVYNAKFYQWTTPVYVNGEYHRYLRLDNRAETDYLATKEFVVDSGDDFDTYFLLEKGRKYIVKFTIDTSLSQIQVNFEFLIRRANTTAFNVKDSSRVIPGDEDYPRKIYHKMFEPSLSCVTNEDYHIALRMTAAMDPSVVGTFTLPGVTVHILEL